MKTIGPIVNKWKQYRNLILLLVAVVAMVLIGSFVLEVKNKTVMYIGVFAYAAIFISFLFRMMAEKVTIDSTRKVVTIYSYNVFKKKETVIPYSEVQFEFYKNRLAKGKGGLIFYQNEQFKFYLTLNQPGWTVELIDEVLLALRDANLKEKADPKAK